MSAVPLDLEDRCVGGASDQQCGWPGQALSRLERCALIGEFGLEPLLTFDAVDIRGMELRQKVARRLRRRQVVAQQQRL